ncbi:MAG TPA: Wzz/FepE/Etk N-terminal domain-containing protein [Planctomycetota bacterium]|nr:Wzz/FepE/Etk N-terminal domain-containing protein [Planctomycetota bacterium]
MSLRYFIHILFKRKWYILTALLAAPLIALGILFFVEPVYVSKCKLEVHDRSSEEGPMSTRRSNIKDDVFIQAQIELIFTDQVLGKVVDKAGLVPDPPSRSYFARLTSYKSASKLSPELQRIEAIRLLRKRVIADEISPVVLNITAQMNTPELSQQVAKGVYEAYVEEFEKHQGENTQFKDYYEQRLKGLAEVIDECQRDMEEFSKQHPRATLGDAKPPQFTDKPPTLSIDPPARKSDGDNGVTRRDADLNPVQTIQNEIARLEVEAINLRPNNTPESYVMRTNQEKLTKARELFEKYRAQLTEQEALRIKWDGLVWKQATARESFAKVNEEYQRLLNKLATQNKSESTITVLDAPTFDPQAIFPKKSLILLGAAFIGLVLGLGMAYIAHVLDSTYHLPEDFAADTGIPVLAAIPYDRDLAHGIVLSAE